MAAASLQTQLTALIDSAKTIVAGGEGTESALERLNNKVAQYGIGRNTTSGTTSSMA